MSVRANFSLTEVVVHTTTLGTGVLGAATIYASCNPDVTLGEVQPKIRNVALGALGVMTVARLVHTCRQPKNTPVRWQPSTQSPSHTPVREKKGSSAPLIVLVGVVAGVGGYLYLNKA